MNMEFPVGLRHILEVYRLVRQSRLSRISATKEVADKHRRDHQTVSSACTRSLGINTEEFDGLLLPQNANFLCKLLIQRFPSFQNRIENFFKEIEGWDEEPNSKDPARVIRTLFPEEKKSLLRTLLVEDVREKLSRWAERNDIPDDLKHEIQELRERIDSA